MSALKAADLTHGRRERDERMAHDDAADRMSPRLMAVSAAGARAAARALALASAGAEERAPCARWPRRCARARRTDPRRQRATTSPRRKRAGTARRLPRPADARRRRASRRWRAAVDDIAALPDPVGRVLARLDAAERPRIERVATPLGVIGVIYESRPNVTADAGALCLKAGNAAILRGGSESFRTLERDPRGAASQGLREAGLPADAIQLVPTRDRAAVGAMLRGPRRRHRRDRAARRQEPGRARAGARRACRSSPISKASATSMSMRAADLDMARAIVAQRQDAAHRRLRRDRDAAGRSRRAPTRILRRSSTTLLDAGCEVRGDARRAGGRSRA